ncbi:MAG: GNAT family N-acetyltransferase [Micavibrio sp.]|nr:GNAT family N-acetyltransferase [Micavibrio sp.]|tara:strand:+ start:409 stop:897 length:489 start_codon:yes stop_codon:yes gene_type:complete
MIELREATIEDIPALYVLYGAMGKSDKGYFESCFDKGFIILIASREDQDVGFTILNFSPKYALYKKLDIPEIQDLNVIPDARQKGIATTIVNKCEEMAEAAGKSQIGISVPLNKSYGPAQRLYIKLGYMPDGNGITYDREPVKKNCHYAPDDDLCLMMLKDL